MISYSLLSVPCHLLSCCPTDEHLDCSHFFFFFVSTNEATIKYLQVVMLVCGCAYFHFGEVLPNPSPVWLHRFILLSALIINSCFPTPSPTLGQTFDFCQSNGCKVASKWLAFPSVRVGHLYICLSAILVFSSLVFLFSYGMWLDFLLHLWIILYRSFEFDVRFIKLFSYELCLLYLI